MSTHKTTIYQPTDRSTHPLYFRLTNGRKVRVDRLPQTVTFGEVARISAVDRQGRKALTRNVGPGLRTLSFTQVVGNRNGSREWDCEADLDAVLYLARNGWAFRITGAASRLEQTTWWQAVGCSVNITHRTSQNRASRAEVEWDLQEYVGDAAVAAKPKPATKKAVTKKTAKAAPARTYTVRSGDSLWKIAARLLGNGTRWREIHALNRKALPNPNRLRVGQVLKVPR